MLLLTLQCSAQQKASISCSFEKDTVQIGYATTFNNKLHIQNNTATAIRLIKQLPGSDGALIAAPDTILIQPRSKRVFPVKYLSSKQIIKKAVQQFVVQYRADGRNINPLSAAFYTKLTEPEQLLMQAIDPVVYLDQRTQQVSFRIKVLNKAYTPTSVSVMPHSASDALQFTVPEQRAALEPGTENLLVFTAHIITKKIDRADFQVEFVMQNQQGKLISSQQVNIILLSSSKVLGNPVTGFTPDNSLELKAIAVGQNYQYLLQGNGNIKLAGDSKLNYNFNANYYNTISAFDLRDTYLNFESKNLAVKAGTIAENLEIPLYGRGVKATGMVNDNALSVYYVNNAYLLYGNINNDLPEHAPNTWAATFHHQYQENVFFGAAYIHQYDALRKFQTDLVNANGSLQLHKNHVIDFTAGYSAESNAFTLQNKLGYAGGFNYTGSFRALEIASNNFISTAYYSGLRRGTIQLNEQLSYPISPAVRLVARFTKLKNNPEYISSQVFAATYNNLTTFEMVASVKASNQLLLSIRPYIQSQSIQRILFANAQDAQLMAQAHRIATDLRYSFLNGHTLALNTDYGIMHNRQMGTSKQSLRLTLNYYSGAFGLNAFAQMGPYYLLDQYYLLYNQYNTTYSAAPYVSFSLFRNKLNLNLSNNINYSKSYTYALNTGFSGTAKLNLPDNWSVSAQVYYNKYEGYNRSQTQLGILKNFNVNATASKHKLELVFFEDANSNGILDEHENLKPDVLVSLDNTVSKTNDHGKAVYSNIPSGLHQIQVIDAKGWHCAPLDGLLLKANTKRQIALTRNALLTGRIAPVKQKYQQTTVMLEGIRITATDAQNRSYFTLTDEEGNFSLSLPVNQYTISTDTQGAAYTITNAKQQVNVTQQQTKPIAFILIDRSQKIEVQRF